MKRKVIQLAGKTLVVSLPNKWAKKYGVKKGDEMEVEEEERKIVIKAKGEGEKAIKVLDVKDLKVMLKRVTGALYKAGYEEIEITYYEPEQYEIIRDVLNRYCMGFEVVKHGQRTITIKSLSDLHFQEFDNILRRLFLSLLSSAEDSLEYIKQSNFKGMEEIILRDAPITKYSDFCRRTLNVQGSGNAKKTTTYYHICEELERIGDAYADLMKFMLNNKIKKLDIATLNFISEINKYLRTFYELFYGFSFTALEQFGQMSEKLKKELEKRFESTSPVAIKINHHLYKIFYLIFNMNGALIVSNV